MTTRRTIWIAIAFSTVIYAVLAYAAERDFRGQPLRLMLERPVVIALYVIAIAIFAFGISLGRRADAGSRLFVVQLALFEAVAILGLCSAFVIHDWRLYVPSWILALIGFSRTWPAENS